MRSYSAASASYADVVDMLYVLIDPSGSLSRCHSVEDTPSGITVMYSADGSAIGAEVSDFLERYSLPATIHVDAREPFDLTISEANGIGAA
ncbi:hypothetical protein E0L17_05060 [Olsenella sp. SW781]|uniref:hypothetical protein n=1 Tax=Olsenella sp. SW781 TaxID=2530046 RepID=UPI00143C2581|nr:hypothetical protein [Olsenella sp. SW781]NJE80695.1 hypothetical protein [Olsenella sp. SW781]